MESRHRPFLCLAIATILQLKSTEQCTQGEVQLVDGWNQYEGRVEVCDDGEWKTVCDRGWKVKEAIVVCRQLNYSDPSRATFVRRGCAGHGSENQSTFRVEWECNGEELKLLDCNKKHTTASRCDHRRDAGVYCSGQTHDNCEEDDLRLVDGPNSESGRIEVCQFGCWGTVCDEEWDRDDAIVTCKQLGFETEEAIPTWGGYFGSASSNRPILLSQTECGRDDDILLTSCSSFHLNSCTHSQDAGVFCYGTTMCQNGEVRLVGGGSERQGRVEMCYNGVWSAVCADEWNEIAASFVCSKLGYILGNYSTTICQNGEVRLVGRGSERQGRVEMCFNGVWSAVCADEWNEIAASLVCSKLGYILGNYSIAPWISPPLFNNTACSENHSVLLQCIDMHNISFYDCENNTAGVICEIPSPDNTTSLTMTTSQTIDLTSPATSNTQSSILGVVGGLLAVGAITVISVASVVIIIMVVVKRKTKRIIKGFGMDNPTYDECQGTPTLNNMTINHELEREFENPIYSDETIETGHNSASKTTSQLQNMSHYEGVYFESTTVNEILYERADSGVQGAHGNGTTNSTGNGMEDSDGVIMKGAISEGVYELPPNLDDTGDENCYSTLDPTYSQLQAHLRVPKPRIEIQSPQNNDDYSRLQYT